jgi:chromosome segregation ATPase
MKTKIVLWGRNDKEEKLLLAIELLEQQNQIGIHTFPESVATEEFYNKMMNIWRDGGPVPFPEGHEYIERNLTMADSLLPDHLKTERTDIINRAKTEWHFVVLSNKLSDSFKDEIEELKERIERLTEFDTGIWEEMKGFWSKVQSQVREKNLFREHANELKHRTNNLFDKMKELKKSMDAELDRVSETHLKAFFEKLDDIEDRISKGLGLQPIFNELKKLQAQFRDADFNRKDRNKVWKKLDGAFKKVKEKKYGGKQGDTSSISRIKRRYDGLLAAIDKMEISINRDKKEIDFQQNRIDSTDGQLEAQLRQAKLAMIGERIKSKDEKLKEMLRTKVELEQKMKIEQEREEERKQKEEIKKEKEEVKAQIAAQIQENQSELEEESEKLEKAAAAIKEMKGKKSKKKTEEEAEVEKQLGEKPAEEDIPPSDSSNEEE